MTSFNYLSLNNLVLHFLLMILKYTLFFREVLDSNIQTKTEQKLERHHTYPSFTYTQSLLSSVSYNRIQGLQSMTPH